MTQRLFVAILLSPEQLAAFGQYGGNYRQKNINWTKVENLHLTVHFFGEVEEEKFFPLIAALAIVAQQIEPFVLDFNKIIFGPPERIPKMIWAIFHGHNEFQKLATLIYRESKKYLFDVQEPKFLPHVTLARFKGFIDVSRLNLLPIKIDNLAVKSFVLMASELTPNGSIYTSLKNFNL